MPIWRGTLTLARLRSHYALAGAFVVTFAAAAAIIYFAIGSRHSPNTRGTAAMAPPAAAGSATAPADASAKSMQAEVTALEARLARNGGSADDWNLLARAYEFLGRPDDARRARAHLASPAAGAASPLSAGTLSAAATATEARPAAAAASPAPAAPTPSLAELRQRVKANPGDVQSWLALSETYRAQRDNGAAREALAKVVALDGMTAQSWADYADVLASLAGGSFAGAAGSAIDKALAMDPANPKALWLKASQAHEQHQFSDALGWWKKLRAALPPDSPDAPIIDNNIAEDSSLAGLTPAAAPPVAAASSAPAATRAAVSGTVSIDSRLADRVQSNATLFIYAKAADSPGPPLAVLRTTAVAWPVSFRLDDSMAMIPSRRLSQFDKVVVEARISRSGQATPSSGDLYVTSPVLNPDSGKKLALVINREIS